jgi:hypothetical protein
LCDPITKEWIEQGVTKLKEWGYAQAKVILSTEKETRKYGYFVVTGVHRTSRCLLHCWTDYHKSMSKNFGFSNSPSFVSAKLEGTTRRGRAHSGWVKCPNEDHLVCTSVKLANPLEHARNGIRGGCPWISICALVYRFSYDQFWKGKTPSASRHLNLEHLSYWP